MLRLCSPRFSLLAIAAALTLGPACGTEHRVESPEASLSGATGAQARYRALRTRFFDADARGRASLLGPLRQFLADFPSDERARDVRILSAFAYVEQGDRRAARAVIAPILAGPAGSRRDFGRVAEAAILSRDGEPRRALALFEALNGRIIDLDERFVYGEERSRAAFMTADYDAALRALLDWFVQSPPDRQARVRETANKLLALVPTEELVGALASLRPGPNPRPEMESGRTWLVGTIVERLTRVALERSSAPLARRLLEVAPAALRGTADGQKLVELASSGSRAPAVAGRAVGLLLGLGGGIERRRAAAIGQGIAQALGTAARRTSEVGVELLVRYGTDDVPGAFTSLAADGAALIVAGGDDESARRAAAQAETLHIPLLLLRPPEAPPLSDGFTFVLGLDDSLVADTVSEALVDHGQRHSERVGPGGTPCEIEAAAPGKGRFPLAAWKKAGVEALLVTGDAECAVDLSHELAAVRSPWPLGLGLDASHAYATLGRPTLVVGAGSYPEKLPEGGWYEALGHDAGVLATRALAALPVQGVTRGEDVVALRGRARDALAVAEAELWTSAARGFGGARVLPRKLVVVEGGPGAR